MDRKLTDRAVEGAAELKLRRSELWELKTVEGWLVWLRQLGLFAMI